eukprot:TRINITY_DN30769_c0_g1_i2.p1 TRINITY_DN30769_c0_g1~~TRINITY_DN30769_c0_g1_i2.p1  ORF type:complete len:163 (+),score=2.33 TRINITY_DN30769_c0_g1_i2:114-602(+)
MLRSLVGSEMCIRDRPRAPHVEATSLCPQTHHVAPGPSVTAKELAAASHQARVSNWTCAPLFGSLTSSVPCPSQEVFTEVQPRQKYVPIATPESIRDTLDHFDPLDDLSDSDDDGDIDVVGAGPGSKFSVGGLLQNGLPNLSSESSASVLHRTFCVPRPQQL